MGPPPHRVAHCCGGQLKLGTRLPLSVPLRIYSSSNPSTVPACALPTVNLAADKRAPPGTPRGGIGPPGRPSLPRAPLGRPPRRPCRPIRLARAAQVPRAAPMPPETSLIHIPRSFPFSKGFNKSFSFRQKIQIILGNPYLLNRSSD